MSSGAPHLDLGRSGEAAAEAWYARAGYRVVARNWRCALGEIDLVLSRGDELVFCEVKTRRAAGLGVPHDAVNHRKQRKLRALAMTFLTTSAVRASDVRFDVASVTVGRRGATSVHVFEHAF